MTDVATEHMRTDDVTIRPFQADVQQQAVADMGRRLAACEQPELSSSELRAAFASLH